MPLSSHFLRLGNPFNVACKFQNGDYLQNIWQTYANEISQKGQKNPLYNAIIRERSLSRYEEIIINVKVQKIMIKRIDVFYTWGFIIYTILPADRKTGLAHSNNFCKTLPFNFTFFSPFTLSS